MIATTDKSNARQAGVLYLFLALTGMFGILYVPTQIIVSGDVAQTALNIKANELLYRLGIVSQLTCQTLFVYLVLSLHRLFAKVDAHYSRQMVALVIVSVPIAFLNMLNQIAALLIVSGPDFLSAFEPQQLNGLLMLFFRLYEQGIFVAQVFWGLWLIPFGILLYKADFMPSILGIFMVAGGVGYVVASFVELVFPEFGPSVGPIATIPSAIGEFGTMFWLLIKGVKDKKVVSTAGQTA